MRYMAISELSSRAQLKDALRQAREAGLTDIKLTVSNAAMLAECRRLQDEKIASLPQPRLTDDQIDKINAGDEDAVKAEIDFKLAELAERESTILPRSRELLESAIAALQAKLPYEYPQPVEIAPKTRVFHSFKVMCQEVLPTRPVAKGFEVFSGLWLKVFNKVTALGREYFHTKLNAPYSVNGHWSYLKDYRYICEGQIETYINYFDRQGYRYNISTVIEYAANAVHTKLLALQW